jgi:hypothetical protein
VGFRVLGFGEGKGKEEGGGDKKKERVRPKNQRSFVMHASRRRVFFVKVFVFE